MLAYQDVSFTSCVLHSGGATLSVDGDERNRFGDAGPPRSPPIIRQAAVECTAAFALSGGIPSPLASPLWRYGVLGPAVHHVRRYRRWPAQGAAVVPYTMLDTMLDV